VGARKARDEHRPPGEAVRDLRAATPLPARPPCLRSGWTQLLAGWDALQEAMLATVTGARECLVVTGSRSRDRKYLGAIEAVLAERPSLVYYRALFDPPHHQVLNGHLLELLRLRDPGDRSLGVKVL